MSDHCEFTAPVEEKLPSLVTPPAEPSVFAWLALIGLPLLALLLVYSKIYG